MAFARAPRGPVLLAAATLVAPALAHAAGLEVPDNGAYVLARGGTAVTLGGTAYALQFNPAGLADLDGLDVRVDARLVQHDVTFRRQERINPQTENQRLDFATVANSAGPFLGPGVMVGYRPRTEGLLRRFAFGAGVWGPPGVGRYQYPDPRVLNEQGYPPVDNTKATGQRYTLIESENQILLPSIGGAFRVNDSFSLGLTLQVARASVSFVQAIAGDSIGGFESTEVDAIAKLAVTSKLAPAFVAGATYKLGAFSFAGSFRPKIALDAEGSLDIASPVPSVQILGNQARLQLNLPPVARLGAAWEQGVWSAACEAVWEGWSANDKMVLTPKDIRIKEGDSEKPLPERVIEKGWKDSVGARLGGGWKVVEERDGLPGVQLLAGALFETNAIPSSRQGIDSVSGDRFAGSLGVSARYKGFQLTLSGMAYAPVQLDVTDSEVARSTAKNPDNPPVVVGNGTYTSHVWIAALGLAYTSPPEGK